jgi:hypothetical protein
LILVVPAKHLSKLLGKLGKNSMKLLHFGFPTMEVPHKKNPMVWGMYPYFRKPPFDKIMTSEATGYTLSSRVSGCCTATATACDVLGISLFFITCSTIFCNMSDTLSKDCIHLRTFFTAKTLSKYYCIY